MCDCLPSYRFELGNLETLLLVTFSSNLSFDSLPIIYSLNVTDREEVELILSYSVLYCSDPFYMLFYPTLNIPKCPKIHKYFNLFYYIGQKYHSIGGFLVTRKLAKGAEAEVLEERTLMPHFAVRHRKIAIPRERMKGEEVSGKLWYVILAALSGLHRWGLSWRRIIAATLTFHLLSRRDNFSDRDLCYACDIIALSMAEAALNLALMYDRVYGEETYTIAEPIQLLRRDIVHIKKMLEDILRNPYKDYVIGDICRLFYTLKGEYMCKIYEEVIYWSRELFSRAPLKMGLLDVYYRYKGAYNSANRVCVEADSIYVLAPTESFSPLELYIVFDMCDRLGVEDIVVLYSPEALPQVLFSIVTYQYILNKDRLPEVIRELYDKQSNLPVATLYSPKDVCHRVYLACIPCKSPILAYDALRRIGKILRNDKNFKFVFAPETVSTVPILAALQKLKNENRAIALI